MKENNEENIQSKPINQANATNEDKNLQIGNIISKTEMFIEKNKKALIITISAIVLLVVVFCLYKFWYMPSQEKNAENDMYAAEYYFMQNDYAKALNGDGKHLGMIAIADDYSHTKHGNLAKYYAGIMYLKQNKFQDALNYFEDFKAKDAFLSSQKKSLTADCYWSLNNVDKAISLYKDAAKINPNDFTTPPILMKLGIAYESKKDYEAALDCYNQIKHDFPRSPEFRDIEKYISRVETLTAK